MTAIGPLRPAPPPAEGTAAVILAAVHRGSAETVAEEAAGLARALGATVTVLHAVGPSVETMVALCGLGCEAVWSVVPLETTGPEQRRSAEAITEEVAAPAVGRLAESGVRFRVETTALPHRSSRWGRRRAVAGAVATTARQAGAGAVVLAAPRRRGRGPTVAELVRRQLGPGVPVLEVASVSSPPAGALR
jgi:nucleotide-binding universal stress UspA family protein